MAGMRQAPFGGQMKKLIIELDGQWVLSHRGDEVLPVDAIEGELSTLGIFKCGGGTLTSLFVFFDENKIDAAAAKDKVTGVFADLYPAEDASGLLTLSVEDGGTDVSEDEGGVANASEEEDDDVEFDVFDEGDDGQAVLDEIDRLAGADEFKALAWEIADIAPEIRRTGTQEVFFNRCYLFSIGDGRGLTTCLSLLARLAGGLGLCHMSLSPVREERPSPRGESADAFGDIIRILENGSKKNVKVLCVDISEWMDRTESAPFKAFLRAAEKHSEEFIMVFRIPFVDKDVAERIRFSLNDLLSVRSVSFPPLSGDEIKQVAASELARMRFSLTPPAWDRFFVRISEEKSDGRFYGINTVKKVVRELVYYKQLNNARKKRQDTQINKSDAQMLCRENVSDGLSGSEQLARLVGSESIKKRIEEIVAQIELSVKSGSEERPCIHMRFVGNPGTGKTTVARIIGRILKERGVLRTGNFYEYAGRDLCGRYVGETAPKTAGICRDAYGSVLFIDEAYSLYRGDDNSRDYGREALDTLIAEMENHRSDFVVIMAGYTDDMEKLMEGNAGLASRMPYTIEFPNFTRGQLYEIFASMVKGKFKYDERLLDSANVYFSGLPDEILQSKEFSNARFVRNLFERTWAKAAMRCQLNGSKNVVLTGDDFEQASADREFALKTSKKTRIGF